MTLGKGTYWRGVLIRDWSQFFFQLKQWNVIQQFKLAGNSFQQFSAVSSTFQKLDYHSLSSDIRILVALKYSIIDMNKSWLSSWHNRLPEQQYNLFKAPLILALSAYNSKTAWWPTLFIVELLLASYTTFCKVQRILSRGVRASLNFRKFPKKKIS